VDGKSNIAKLIMKPTYLSTCYLNNGLFLRGCINFRKQGGIVTVKRSRDDISTMEVF